MNTIWKWCNGVCRWLEDISKYATGEKDTTVYWRCAIGIGKNTHDVRVCNNPSPPPIIELYWLKQGVLAQWYAKKWSQSAIDENGVISKKSTEIRFFSPNNIFKTK